MDTDRLIHDKELLNRLKKLRKKVADKGLHFSDIVDDQGHQYVDLVMEGGGMLGIALVGYTWALEEMGIRFLGVGGTSAGSINALLIAALDEPAKAKSPKLLHELVSKDFYDFVDGDGDARDFIETALAKGGHFKKTKLAFKAMQVVDNLTEDLGLNPGDAFHQWLRSILRREGIRTQADLTARLNTLPPGLRYRGGTRLTKREAGAKLAIIAADVSTETRVIFPDHAALYFREPQSVDPSLFARASMSIPFFFHPLRLRSLPRDRGAAARWSKVGFNTKTEKGGVPKSALFVDGGIISNFPIDLFHQPDTVPKAPTFGVKLEYDQRRHEIDGPMALLGTIFNSARHSLDYEFINRHPDYKHLVQWIPCQGYNWLDFDMSDEAKGGLFREGAVKAMEFLDTFDWAAYKELRAKLAALP